MVRVQRSSPWQHASIHPGLVSLLFIYTIPIFLLLNRKIFHLLVYIYACRPTCICTCVYTRWSPTYSLSGSILKEPVSFQLLCAVPDIPHLIVKMPAEREREGGVMCATHTTRESVWQLTKWVHMYICIHMNMYMYCHLYCVYMYVYTCTFCMHAYIVLT